jgi:hypothetical protein
VHSAVVRAQQSGLPGHLRDRAAIQRRTTIDHRQCLWFRGAQSRLSTATIRVPVDYPTTGIAVRDRDVNRTIRPSTIANVSGTGGVKSRPTLFEIFPKKKFQIVAAYALIGRQPLEVRAFGRRAKALARTGHLKNLVSRTARRVVANSMDMLLLLFRIVD